MEAFLSNFTCWERAQSKALSSINASIDEKGEEEAAEDFLQTEDLLEIEDEVEGCEVWMVEQQRPGWGDGSKQLSE